MKSGIQLFIGLVSVTFLSLNSASATDLTLSDACKQRLERSVLVKARQVNDTASITGTKLLYGGERGGLNFASVALVRVSDETEPSDYLVVFEYRRNRRGDGTRCVVRSSDVLNDGSLPDVAGLDN